MAQYKQDALLRLKQAGFWEGMTPDDRKAFEEWLDEDEARRLLVMLDDWEFPHIVRLLACFKGDRDPDELAEAVDALMRPATKALFEAGMVRMNDTRDVELTNRGRKLAEFIDVALSEGENPLTLKQALEEVTSMYFVVLHKLLKDEPGPAL
jgi:hypothetical protein